MADLFLSYAHQDTKHAQTLAKLLEVAGLTVWWDRRMVAGDKIHDVIDEEIEKAKAIIVLWSPWSVKSDWVRGEAQTAHELGKLVPVKIEECKLPINYRTIHTPEIYKKAELHKLAQMLNDKFGSPQPWTKDTERTPAKIEFADESASDFIGKLSAQHVAFEKELADLQNDNNSWEKVKKTFRLIKKYPFGATVSHLASVREEAKKELALYSRLAGKILPGRSGEGATIAASATVPCPHCHSPNRTPSERHPNARCDKCHQFLFSNINDC